MARQMNRRGLSIKRFGLPQRWPKVNKRIKKKYLNKYKLWYNNLPNAELSAGSWN